MRFRLSHVLVVVEGRTPEREVGGSPPPCCVLEQDTLLPKVLTGITQEAVASSRHDYIFLFSLMSLSRLFHS